MNKDIFNKKTISWALYDLANTSYSALIVTVFFPILIKNYLGGNEFHIGLVMGASLFLSALIIPFIGGICDAIKIKKPLLMIFTMTSVLFISFMAEANLIYALIFGLLANLFYHGSLDIYDSYLPELVQKKYYGTTSGFGTAVGYVGTILSVSIAWIIMAHYGWESEVGAKLIFPMTGVFYILFSLPFFFIIKDTEKEVKVKFKDSIVTSFKEVKKTITSIKKYKNIWTFLFASLFYIDSVNTVIVFLFLIGNSSEMNLSLKVFFPIYILFSIFAILGSLLFGYLNDQIGPKKTLISALLLWMVVILSLVIEINYFTYLTAGIVGGALLGAIWTATRPMLIKISPKEKITELFGFQGLTEKMGGAIGPIVYGYLAMRYNHSVALSSVLVFFFIGFILLLKVKEEVIEDTEVLYN